MISVGTVITVLAMRVEYYYSCVIAIFFYRFF